MTENPRWTLSADDLRDEVLANMEEDYPGTGAHLRAVVEIVLAQPLTPKQQKTLDALKRIEESPDHVDFPEDLDGWAGHPGLLGFYIRYFEERRRERDSDA